MSILIQRGEFLHSESQTRHFFTKRLVGCWKVCAVPLGDPLSPLELLFENALTVPECTHIQPFLFPDQPYWGDHLRSINEKTWIYQHNFTTPDHSFQRARLLFEGVDYFAEVWLNDQWIGSHEGHFSPFVFDITDALKEPGLINVLILRVTAPWDTPNVKGTYPSDHVLRGLVKGLYEHGEGVIPPNVNPLGIWRPVSLVLDQGVSLDHIRIRTELNGHIDLQLTLTNALKQDWKGTLNIEIRADNHHGIGTMVAVPLTLEPGTHSIEQNLHVDDPLLWWPWELGKPNLYRLTASLFDQNDMLLSGREETFGFRSVHLERRPDRFTYFINGRPFFIRGSSYMPGLYLSQVDLSTFKQDVALAKSANLNLLRVHVHVSPPELYSLCDREGMLIWQDFELNWVHEATVSFETRARNLQREMISMLSNHPSIITWTCHNEPTMMVTRRHNLERHPDPALYVDALKQDPTRPIFMCSGQMEADWRHSGDTHSYYGAIWSNDYADVYHLKSRISSEFGFETPASAETLRKYPFCWQRLQHLEGEIETLGTYQAELIQFHVEHFRRLRATSCAGYIQFWLVDLLPQVGCGVLDSLRQPKGGYEALLCASQPLLIALEHNGSRPFALWVFNDTSQEYPESTILWRVYDSNHELLLVGETQHCVAANASQPVMSVDWKVEPKNCFEIELTLLDRKMNILAENRYNRPFEHQRRPKGYPWKFDFELGTKVFDKPDAPSMVEQSGNVFLKMIPLQIRESLAEWMVRQHLPPRLLSFIARILDGFV